MFLSFIVPVYNVEKYLTDCLDSLLEQDIPRAEYEIICVNDGSTDGSFEILQEYAHNNANIKLLSKENGGLAAARNTGLDFAVGEYIWFVDSDDFIQRNCLGELKHLAEQTQSDRISIGAYTFREILSKEEIDKSKQGSLCANTGQYGIVVWNNLFRLSHLKENGLRFHPELRYAEDGIYMFEFSLTDYTEVTDESVYYYYRLRAQSLTTANTYEAKRNKIAGDFGVLKYYKHYYLNKQGNPKDIADKLMSTLWHFLFTISELPTKERNEQIKRLRVSGLYPFRCPDACSIKKSYQTTRTDFVGILFDKIYTHQHRNWGFVLMCLWKKAEIIKHKLEGHA